MKPIIKISELKLLNKDITGITLFPFIFISEKHYNILSEKQKKVLINHETIHFKQEIEMLVIPFYLWYGIEYCIKYFKYGKGSYKNLSFERESYFNEKNFNYLKIRKFWNFLKYL